MLGVLFGAAVLVIGLLVYFSVGGFDASTGVLGEPPGVLGGYTLLDYLVGDEAIEGMGGVHSFLPGEPNLIDALIAIYVRDSDIIHIWVAAFDSNERAEELTLRMFVSMRREDSIFSPGGV